MLNLYIMKPKVLTKLPYIHFVVVFFIIFIVLSIPGKCEVWWWRLIQGWETVNMRLVDGLIIYIKYDQLLYSYLVFNNLLSWCLKIFLFTGLGLHNGGGRGDMGSRGILFYVCSPKWPVCQSVNLSENWPCLHCLIY